MSNHLFKPLPKRHQRAPAQILRRMGIFLILLIGFGILPPSGHGAMSDSTAKRSLPLLVKARQGDTSATLAERYLHDASRGWLIDEYNGRATFSEGQAVLIPTAPFRLGGLTPGGYQTVPVLVYTSIGKSSKGKARISPSAFEEQMRRLKDTGFTAITPEQLVAFMGLTAQLPRQAVLITADTESLSFHDLAIPILKAFGFKATLFVATDRVGAAGNMTWNQLKQLQEAGFAIGCRGRGGHSLIRDRDGRPLEPYFNSIETAMREAKQMIEHHLGVPCTMLAYPQGHSDNLMAATAAKLGFSAAFERSAGENPFFGSRFGIHRLVIDGDVSLKRFSEMLTTKTTADLH